MDEDDDLEALPHAYDDPEAIERRNIVYPAWNPDDTVVLSGPLPHGVARGEADEGRRMKRAQAKRWAKKKYGVVLETPWHPHRWCVRVYRKALKNDV